MSSFSQDDIHDMLAATTVLMLLVHCGLYLSGLHESAYAMSSKKHTSGRCDSMYGASEVCNKCFDQSLDDLRLASLVVMRKCALVCCPIVCVVYLLLGNVVPPEFSRLFCTPVVVLTMYAFSLVSASVEDSPIAAHGYYLYVGVMVCLSISTTLLSDDSLPTFFTVTNGQLTAIRFILALPVLNASRVLPWTLGVSFTTSCSYARYLSTLPCGSQRGEFFAHLANYVIVEICTVVLFGVAWSGIESAVKSHLRSVIEARAVEVARSKLLSVLCDAQVLLSATFVVLDNSRSLPGILMADSRTNSASSLNGVSFIELVAECDRRRFYEFFSSSTCTGTQPPASTHLNLKARGGGGISVEFFSVQVFFADDTGQPGYLIGIKVGNAKVSATPTESEEDIQMCSISEASSKSPPPDELGAGNNATQAGNDHSAESNDGSSSSGSAFSGASTAVNCSMVHSVTLTVNVISDRLLIRTIILDLIQEASSLTDAGPSLVDWLPENDASFTIAWLQQNVNAVMQGGTAADHGAMRLVCGHDCFLSAAHVDLSNPYGREATELELDLDLRLRGVTRFVWPPWAQVPSLDRPTDRQSRRRTRSQWRRQSLAAITEEARSRQVSHETEAA